MSYREQRYTYSILYLGIENILGDSRACACDTACLMFRGTRNFRNKKEHYEGKLIDGGQSVDTSQSRQWRMNHLSIERGIIHRLKLVPFFLDRPWLSYRACNSTWIGHRDKVWMVSVITHVLLSECTDKSTQSHTSLICRVFNRSNICYSRVRDQEIFGSKHTNISNAFSKVNRLFVI